MSSFTLAYLIIAHDNPPGLLRLIQSLAAPWVKIYVHIDKKTDAGPFVELLSSWRSVQFVKEVDRVKVWWGGWSQVAATLALLETATKHEVYDRLILVSGVCYPLFGPGFIRDFFLGNDSEYITTSRMPRLDINKPMSRLNRWHFEGGSRAGGVKATVIKIANKLLSYWPARDLRLALGKNSPYAGSQWWALSGDAAKIILSETKKNKRLVALFKYSFCPDESYFHTILANSNRCHLLRPSLTYVDWSNPKEQPAVITNCHEGKIAKLLARKVPSHLFIRKISDEGVGVILRISQSQ